MSIYSSMVRNRDHSPLDRELLRRVVPSAFAPCGDARLSSRYSFLPTDALLDRMASGGFQPVAAQEQRSRRPGGLPTRKHLLRFAQSDALSSHTGDERVEVCLINSHDGSSSYRLMAGVFRFVCANGLVVGAMLDGFSVRHCHADAGEVLAASLKLADSVPLIRESIRAMQGQVLSLTRQLEFAEQAALLRFGLEGCPGLEPARLLQARRYADVDARADGVCSLWQVFNRVQECLVKGGLRLPPLDRFGSRRSLRAVSGIDGNTRLNRSLWDLAVSFAA